MPNQKVSGSRPIIFNSDSVRAILENRKTQSRRTRGLDQLNDPASKSLWHLLRTEGDIWTFTHPSLDYGHAVIKCPYGIPGDSLWVRETWATLNHFDDILPRNLPDYAEIIFKATDEENMLRGKWRSPIYLPKKFSRLAPVIKDVRVERVQDITEEDAKAEGCHRTITDAKITSFGITQSEIAPAYIVKDDIKAKSMFQELWDSINAKKGYGWDTNPWVWVLEFEAST